VYNSQDCVVVSKMQGNWEKYRRRNGQILTPNELNLIFGLQTMVRSFIKID